MHFSLAYKRLECVDPKEKNRKHMYDQIKSRRKNFIRNFFLFKHKLLKKIKRAFQIPISGSRFNKKLEVVKLLVLS